MQLDALPWAAMIVNGALEVLDCNKAALKAVGLAVGSGSCERLAQALAETQTELVDNLALATASLTLGEEERFGWRNGDSSFEVSISLHGDERRGRVFRHAHGPHQRNAYPGYPGDGTALPGADMVGVVVLDRNQRITSTNTQMLSFFDKLAGVADLVGVIGSTLLQVLPDSPGSRWHALCEEIIAGSVQAAEAEKGAFDTDQGDLVLSTEVTPLRDQGGALTGTILMTTDITERARLEQELMRMEKLATVGQMVVTINHEINNPLLIISTNAQAMRLMNPDLDEKTTKKLYKIEEQVKRISEVTERLRSLDEVSSEEYIAQGPQMIDLWGRGGASGKDEG